MKCSKCGTVYDVEMSPTICGKEDYGRLDISYDYNRAMESLSEASVKSRPRDIWRWKELLPVDERYASRLGEGGTPLIKAERLGELVGLPNLYLKDETRNPTGSFKDRAMAVSVAKAVQSKARVATTASSGNAAASLSAYAACASVKVVAFVLDTASDAKVAQLVLYGAKVIKVRGIEGGVDPTVRMMLEVVRRRGWYPSPSFGPFNPYQVEGPKTIPFEIAEDFGWKRYDWLLAPTGSSCLAAGLWKGVRDMREVGLAEWYPHIVPVQPAGNSALVRALKAGIPASEIKAETRPSTVASGLDDPYPWDADCAIEGVKSTGGRGESVDDAEILDAVRELARREGIFAEPSGAAALAGARRLRSDGVIDRGDIVVVLVTGSGLKDIESLGKLVGPVPTIGPDVSELEGVLA